MNNGDIYLNASQYKMAILTNNSTNPSKKIANYVQEHKTCTRQELAYIWGAINVKRALLSGFISEWYDDKN